MFQRKRKRRLTPLKPFVLTESMEDYLETIYLLVARDPHQHAHTRDIANHLKVKQPSVTSALSLLCENGYIDYRPNYPVTLTPKGMQEAMCIFRRHAVIANFFRGVLAVEASEASALACRMEHIISDTLLSRLECLTTVICDRSETESLRMTLKSAFEQLPLNESTPPEE